MTVLGNVTVPQNYQSKDEFRRRLEGSSSFQPIRISFDVSKLSSDPGYMCQAAGDVVQVDGAGYVCTKDDVLTDVGEL